ncbi:MAG: glycosyltransferase [Bacteroidota bacterium]
MKKKVLVYNDSFLKYSETFIYRQLSGLRDDFELHFLCHQRLNPEKFPFSNTHVIPYGMLQSVTRLFNPFKFAPDTAGKVRHLLQDLSPDLIHVHFGTHAMKIIPVAKALDIPVLITFWGSDASKRLRSSQYVRTLKTLLPETSVICCSAALKLNLQEVGVDVSQAVVHYVGASTSKFAYVDRQPIGQKLGQGKPIVFLQVGRFVEKKGHLSTIKAIAQMLQTTMRGREHLIQIQFIGGGPMEGQAKELTHSLGIQNNFQFLGVKTSDEVQRHMSEADVLLQHSVTSSKGDMEGLPIVIMEAMATGLPVVSTFHSGIPELIHHGESGFLVEEHDVAAYSRVLADVLVLQDDQINREARAKIEAEFDLEKQNRKLADHYTQSMEHR